MSSGITYVTSLDLNGLPIEPPEARKAFKRACKFQVRDNASITIQDWRLVPETTKEQLWRNIMEKIKYPDGVDEEFVKSVTLISCHTRFLRPKPDAHRMYAQDQVVIHTVRM
jgi:Glu-tRNA(Gln) amidotransferase subunit E-like FAD-binding protein